MAHNPPGGIPNQADFGLLRAWLAIHGFSQAQINAAIGHNPNGRTRAQIADELKAWLLENDL